MISTRIGFIQKALAQHTLSPGKVDHQCRVPLSIQGILDNGLYGYSEYNNGND